MSEIVHADRDGSVWIKAKVLPGKDALDFFMQKWAETGKVPFNGEFNPPASNELHRLMGIEVQNISHCVLDVDADQFDAKTSTVPIKCRFTGPRGEEAQEKFLSNDIRVLARTVVDPKSKEMRIATFDLVQRPDANPVDDAKRIKEKQDEAKARKAHK